MFSSIIRLSLSTGHTRPVLSDVEALYEIKKTIKDHEDWIQVSITRLESNLARYTSKIEVDILAILAEIKAHSRYLNVQITLHMVKMCTYFVLCHEYRHTQDKNKSLTSDKETDANEYACCCLIDYMEEI